MTTISTPAEQVPASAPPAPRPDVNRKRMARLGWSFSAPALILIAAVTIFPIIYSVVMSLSNVTVTGSGINLGGFTTSNYSEVLSDSTWHYAIGFTVVYTVITVLVELVLGTLIALVLQRLTGGRGWMMAVLLTLALAVMFRVLQAFGLFDLPWVLTNGGPGTATTSLAILGYKAMFQNLHFGTGAAVATTTALLVLLGCLASLRTFKVQVGKENS